MTAVDVLDPATEQVIETVPQATAEDAGEAIRRARDAYPAWKAVAPDLERAIATAPYAYLGRELGPDALDGFTDVKNVFIATDG